MPIKTFTFEISAVSNAEVWRVLELRADQTLEALHLAIEQSFERSFGRDYAFYIEDLVKNNAHEYRLPDDIDTSEIEIKQLFPQDASETEEFSVLMADDLDTSSGVHFASMFGPPHDVRSAIFDDLGLALWQRFQYVVGGKQHFIVRLTATNDDAPADVTYPLLVQGAGELPPQ